HDALERLERHIARYPNVEHVEHCMKAAGLDGGLEYEEFSLLFKSSREFFFAPVIEYGPLGEWKEIAGEGQEMQDVFWYIKEAIDADGGDRRPQPTAGAGSRSGRKQAPPPRDSAGPVPRAEDTPPYARPGQRPGQVPGQVQGGAPPAPPEKIATGSVQTVDPE